MPSPLRTELAGGSGDPMTVALLMTSFLLGQRLVYLIPSTLCDLRHWCTQWVLRKDVESVFGLQKWRMDGPLSTQMKRSLSLLHFRLSLGSPSAGDG